MCNVWWCSGLPAVPDVDLLGRPSFDEGVGDLAEGAELAWQNQLALGHRKIVVLVPETRQVRSEDECFNVGAPWCFYEQLDIRETHQFCQAGKHFLENQSGEKTFMQK